MRCTRDCEFEEEDSSWASDQVDRVGQGISTKVKNFRSSDNNDRYRKPEFCANW